jgi:y4mF family transcriptional regulator
MLILDAASFGQMIRRHRNALQLQQRELALAVGVGERFIVELEAGKPTCQLGKALAVAQALRIPLNDGAESTPVNEGGYDLPDIQLP